MATTAKTSNPSACIFCSQAKGAFVENNEELSKKLDFIFCGSVTIKKNASKTCLIKICAHFQNTLPNQAKICISCSGKILFYR
jgi:hypothetical protein